MSKENKKIADPGLRLVAAVFATIGTLLIAIIELFVSPSTSDEQKDNGFKVDIENGFLVSKSNNVTVPLEDLDNK